MISATNSKEIMPAHAATNGKVMGSVYKTPPEVWRLVADEIQGPRNLSALVKVSHAFRDIFTPYLYARHILDLNQHRPGDLKTKTIDQNLAHTKDFEVRIEKFGFPNFARDFMVNDDYASFVAKMLRAMPKLQKFQWNDSPYGSEHDPSFLLGKDDVMKALKSCKLLRHLHISFECHSIGDAKFCLKCTLPLAGFHNLSSFELHNFGGRKAEQVKNIASVLHASPNLKRLSLGTDWNADSYGVPEILFAGRECDFFLEKLCLEYQALKGPPLKLETLRLGQGVFPIASKTSDVGNYLAKLADLSKVKTLHLFNAFDQYVEEEEDEYVPLYCDWAMFDPCASLRQLAVTRLGAQVRHWLNTSGLSVEELIVTDHYDFYNKDLKNFDRLRLPNLNCLFTREVKTDNLPVGWVESDSDSDESDSGTRYGDLEPKSGNAIITVLDRLHDGGASLKHLGICLDLENSWEQFVTHLPNLTRLTQLRLNSKSACFPSYPTEKPTIWSVVEKNKDICGRYAQVIKWLCPSLQYVQVGGWVWQVTTPVPGAEIEDNIYRWVHLRLLEYDEVMAIDLFSMQNSIGESRLRELEKQHEGSNDEEYELAMNLVEKIEARFKESRAAGLFSYLSDEQRMEEEKE